MNCEGLFSIRLVLFMDSSASDHVRLDNASSHSQQHNNRIVPSNLFEILDLIPSLSSKAIKLSTKSHIAHPEGSTRGPRK